jgi:hypothetical protein
MRPPADKNEANPSGGSMIETLRPEPWKTEARRRVRDTIRTGNIGAATARLPAPYKSQSFL